jgi:hypothetical protein
VRQVVAKRRCQLRRPGAALEGGRMHKAEAIAAIAWSIRDGEEGHFGQ